MFRRTPHSTPSTQYSSQSSGRFYRSEPVEKRPRVPLRSTDANATYRPNQRLFDRLCLSTLTLVLMMMWMRFRPPFLSLHQLLLIKVLHWQW